MMKTSLILGSIILVSSFGTSYAISDAGLDRWLMKLVDMNKAGDISDSEFTNAMNYIKAKHIAGVDQFKNAVVRALIYQETGKYDPTVLEPVKSNPFNTKLMKCDILSDQTSANILGDITNRDTSPHTVIINYSVLDSSNQVIKQTQSDRHQIAPLGEWLVQETISGTLNIDHCSISVQVIK